MSFWGIVGLVLGAAVILILLFAFFHILFMLLPAIIIIAVIIWLINHFTKNDDYENRPSSSNGNWTNWQGNSVKPKRKKARNVKTKDVDK